MRFSGRKEAVLLTDKKQTILLYYYIAHGYMTTYYTRIADGKNKWHSMSCSTGDVAVLLMGTKKQELARRYPEGVFSMPSCSCFSPLAGSWSCTVPWKRRAVAVELKTSIVVSGTQRMPDWSGSVKKSDLAVSWPK